MQINENLIREQAYKIWESEGRPDGCDLKHWEMARQSLSMDHSDLFIPHQNTKVGKHAHHPHHPH